MQKETWAKAIRKQAITDAIEALRLPQDYEDSIQIRSIFLGRAAGYEVAILKLDEKIADLKRKEGIDEKTDN